MGGRLSIIVPVFNEQENIAPLAREVREALAGAGWDYELVFVDDGSTDRTWEQIQEAVRLEARVRALRHEANAGQSAALWTGLQSSSAPVIATLDGDGQNDPHDLPRLLAEVESCDFVCGVRLRREDRWLRRVSARIARTARKLALRVDFRDTGCGIRVFHRRALNGVFPFQGLHRLLPVLAHLEGARVREVPVHHRPRTAGTSKYGVRNRAVCGLADLAAVAWYQRRRIGSVRLADTSGQRPAA